MSQPTRRYRRSPLRTQQTRVNFSPQTQATVYALAEELGWSRSFTVEALVCFLLEQPSLSGGRLAQALRVLYPEHPDEVTRHIPVSPDPH